MTNQPDSHSCAIDIAGATLAYDRRTVLDDINLRLDRGDFLAITGPNGGGKTSLLRLMLKLIAPTRGRVIYLSPEGREVKRLSIGYLPQKNLIDSRFPITVSEVVASGLLSSHLPTAESDTRVADMLERMGIDTHASASIGTLSGGQLQRTLLGRALISRPEILVLDEPLSYIDKRFEERFYDIIADVAPMTTIVLVSHEMTRIASMATRHISIDRTLTTL